MSNVLPQDLAEWSPEKLDEVAKEQAELFVKKRLRTSQIRNIYSTIVRIRNDYQREGKRFEKVRTSLVMLRPKLAYAAGRNSEVRPFRDLLDGAIEAVLGSSKPERALENFFALAEAVVAYHKFHGGKD